MEAITQFLEIVKVDSREVAEYYLALTDGDIQTALGMYFEDTTGAASGELKSEVLQSDCKLTVLEWNIQGLLLDFLSERMQAVVAIIKLHRPTVLMLQEVTHELYCYLKSTLDSDYRGFSPVESNEVCGHYFAAMFFSKTVFQFHTAEVAAFSSSKQGRQVVSVQGHFQGHHLTLMTSHLESLKSGELERKKQLEMVFNLMKRARPKSTVIFGGDTNLRDPEFRSLVQSGSFDTKIINDVWAMLGSPEEARYSWDLLKNDNQVQGGKARLRFERLYTRVEDSSNKDVFKPSDMKFVGLDRLECGKFPSDHWGILASFAV